MAYDGPSTRNEEGDTCKNLQCKTQIKELLLVNKMWRVDYGELMQQNQKLEARLKSMTSGTTPSMTQSLRQPDAPSGYINYKLDDIERLKNLIEHYKTEYENEKKERERQEQMNRQLTRKLIDNENITFHFHSRVDHLERRLERQKFNTKREFTTCNCEQERNIELMRRQVIPPATNIEDVTSPSPQYKDERDRTNKNQSNRQLKYSSYKDVSFPENLLEKDGQGPGGQM